ncbi:hypothetical protein Pcinc_014330, partial [Petrolisthes cinctipes]
MVAIHLASRLFSLTLVLTTVLPKPSTTSTHTTTKLYLSQTGKYFEHSLRRSAPLPPPQEQQQHSSASVKQIKGETIESSSVKFSQFCFGRNNPSTSQQSSVNLEKGLECDREAIHPSGTNNHHHVIKDNSTITKPISNNIDSWKISAATRERKTHTGKILRRKTERSEKKTGDSDLGTSVTDETYLMSLLMEIVMGNLKHCSLLLAFHSVYTHSVLLHSLLHALPNSRQVVVLDNPSDLAGVLWEGELCRGYLYFLNHQQQPNSFLTFAGQHNQDQWDYQGRHVVVGATKEQLQSLFLASKPAKTPHLIGLVKGWRDGEWVIYSNTLFSTTNTSLSHVATWRHHTFTTNTTTANTFTANTNAANTFTVNTSTANKTTSLFPDKLSDLGGAELKVVTFEFEPSVLYYRDSNGSLLFPFGIDIEVVRALSQALNCSLVFMEPPKGELWGVKTEDGTWDGMVGKLARGEADIGVANLFLTLGRQGAVDYSAPYDAEVSCFLVRSDPPSPRWQSLVLPFQLSTWLSLLLGLVLAALFLFCFAFAGNRCGGETINLQSMMYVWIYSVGMHCREPQALMPRRHTTRLLVSFLWLYTIIITVAYSSNLTAFLTVTRQPQGMETVRELHASKMEVSGLGTFFKGALASAVDPYLQGLGEKFVAYQDLMLVWDEVKRGRAVYLHNKQFLEFVITTQFTTTQGLTTMRIMK